MLDSEEFIFFLLSIIDFFVNVLFKIIINSIKNKVIFSLLLEILLQFFSVYEITFLNNCMFKFETVSE